MRFSNVMCFLCLFCCMEVEAYKVLVLYPFPVRSINLLGEGIVKHLLKGGHQVTYMTAYPIKNPPKLNFTQVDISSTQQLFQDDLVLDTSFVMDNVPETEPYYIQMTGYRAATFTFNDTNFQKFLDDTTLNFDLVIADFIETELYAGVAALYNCPLIWSYSMGAHSVALRLVGESSNPAYVIDYLTSNVVPFTFQERVQQLWTQIQWHYYKKFYTMPQEEALYKQFFSQYFAKRGRNLPDYQSLIHNASMVFGNEHLSLGNVPALPQNFKFIGGIHVEVPPKPLPENLQSILDNAKNGVVYFSLGSTWKSKDMPKSLKDNLLKLFGELKQTVIWKYEEDLQNMPQNLHIIKWAPQQSILAHPNIRLFISHGGHLGTTEAFHFGVPIIGIPLYLDQHINIKKAVKAGYALSTSLGYDLHNNLRFLIREMLSNPKYGEKAKELSWIYHHRPVSPGQELLHWVEHVVHTRGAPHLRSPALHMPFYQLYYLDLVVLLSGVITVAVVVLKRASCQLLCKNRSALGDKKNN